MEMVATVETAIPAFIGYTEQGAEKVSLRITSLLEYTANFGQGSGPFYYALQLYFANGGGPCYIFPVDNYATAAAATLEGYTAVLDRVAAQDGVTLLVLPDAPFHLTASYYALVNLALQQCLRLGDRFAIIDVLMVENDLIKSVKAFREGLTITAELAKFGAAYFPNLRTTFNVELTPSAAIAGVYASVDSGRGVWKSPANVALVDVTAPVLVISDLQQEGLNVDAIGGKSINAIRTFTGKGILVWGARTLAGNDNDWRYVSVCRYCIMVEESIKRSSGWVVSESNDSNTWGKVKTMIENFLTLQWRAGALAGTKPDAAFYVRAGLNETMTAADIQEGRLIIEIGIAVTRPAEFIILRINKVLQTS